jgi:hypothetical protein
MLTLQKSSGTFAIILMKRRVYMNYAREGFRIYVQNIGPLLLLALTIVLPVLLLHTIYVNYIYAVTVSFASTYIGEFVNSFLVIMLLVFIQIPFIQYINADIEGEENKLKKAYAALFKYGFSVYVFGVVYAFLSIIGLAVFIIPGIIILVFFFLTPYLSVIRQESAWKTFRMAFTYGKKNFLSLFTIILLTSMGEFLISVISLYGVAQITTNYLAVLLSQIILNMLLLPLIVSIITLFTKNLEQGVLPTETYNRFAEN